MACERKEFVKSFEHPDRTIKHEPHYSETHQPMFARECVRGHQTAEETLDRIVTHGAGSVDPARRKM